MRAFFIVAIIFLVTGSSFFPTESEASGPAIKWEQTYENSGSCYSMITTSDGGYLLAGYKGNFSIGEADALIIKTDGEGNEEWRAILGGDSSEMIEGTKEVPGEGYIAIGYSYSFSSDDYCDYYLIMLDYEGNELWSKTYGGSCWDFGYQVELAYEGGFLFVGTSYSYGEGLECKYLIKTNDYGEMEWDAVINNSSTSKARDITKTDDGNYFIAGEDGYFRSQMSLLKIDREGNVIWNKTYGGDDFDTAYSLKRTADGGAILIGKTMSFGPCCWNVFAIRTDRDGNRLWNFIRGGDEWDEGFSVITLPDGGFVLAGDTNSVGPRTYKTFLIRLNGKGEKVWEDLYSPIDDFYIMNTSDVRLSRNGGIVVADTGPNGFRLFETESEFLIDLDTEMNPVGQ